MSRFGQAGWFRLLVSDLGLRVWSLGFPRMLGGGFLSELLGKP
jgi:hypothetical protein